MSGEWRYGSGESSDDSGREVSRPSRFDAASFAEADRSAWREARQRRERIDMLAEAWREVQLTEVIDPVRPRFNEVCAGTENVRIPPLLLQDAVMDPDERPEAEVFEKLGFRIHDDDERWADATELIAVLRKVLPESRVTQLSEVDTTKTYVVCSGIVGPNNLPGLLTTTWTVSAASAPSYDPESPLLIDAKLELLPGAPEPGAGQGD